MTEMDELAAALSLEIAEAVMGNPTVEAVFSPDDLDGFKSDIQIEAMRVLNAHFARSRPPLSPAGVTEEQVAALTKTFCGDKLNGGVLRDMAFTVWQKCQKPTHEDGNTDWFNDTLPVVDAAVEQLRAALEAAAKAHHSAGVEGWKKAVDDFDVEAYVEDYEFRGEGDYIPTDNEKVVLADALEGAIHAISEAAAKAQPRDYTDFDTWFHEQEGTSLRCERFNGDVEWLKAAFDAGRSAQPISTGQGETVAWPKWATDKHIAEGIIGEADAIVQLLIHGKTIEIAEHTGAIKSFAGTLLTREAHRHKFAPAHPSLPAGHVAVPVEATDRREAGIREAAQLLGDIAAINSSAGQSGVPKIRATLFREAQASVLGLLAALPHNQGEGK